MNSMTYLWHQELSIYVVTMFNDIVCASRLTSSYIDDAEGYLSHIAVTLHEVYLIPVQSFVTCSMFSIFELIYI